MIFSRRLDITPKEYRQRFQETEGSSQAVTEKHGEGEQIMFPSSPSPRREHPHHRAVAATAH